MNDREWHQKPAFILYTHSSFTHLRSILVRLRELSIRHAREDDTLHIEAGTLNFPSP